MTRVWIDVEDLFQYAITAARPSGIQRLAFEIQSALVERFGTGGVVRFIRHDPLRACLAEIAWEDVAALYRDMVTTAARARPALRRPTATQRRGAARRLFARTINRLPSPIREPLARAVRLQKSVFGTLAKAARLQVASWLSLAHAVRAAVRPPPSGPNALLTAQAAAAFATCVQPGDILLALGSPWWHADYTGVVERERRRHGMRFALLVYDLIPIRHPEWFQRDLITIFNACLDSVLPLADAVLAISRATASDVERHAARRGLALRGAVTPIPVGAGFAAAPAGVAPSPGLPPPGTYVLFVSTIEARKNHALLFRVWRRLLDEAPQTEVPTLVFAGRVGWLVDDLLQQLENTNSLDGRVVVIEEPSDADLAALYAGCLFTLFPSFYEGWGLPVTESLAFGKPCVIANTTSLPEAGGGFARYFDPDDLHDAVRVIRAALDDRPGLAAWEDRIRRDYRPTPWSASADAVMTALAPGLPADAGRNRPTPAIRSPA